MKTFNEKEKQAYSSNLGIYPIDDSIFVGDFKSSIQRIEIGLT